MGWLDNKVVAEFQSLADNTNGGIYKSDAGTTDYSQQTTAQATFTNLSTDATGKIITDDDAGGNMTAQMVGNGFQVNGGYYLIDGYTDSNTVTIDSSAGSSLSGLSGKIGGAWALMTYTIFDLFKPDNEYHVKNDGTYTLTGSISVAADGSGALPIRGFYYNNTRGDNPTGTNRPLVACGAYQFNVDDYWYTFNPRMTGTYTQVFAGTSSLQFLVVNGDFNNTSGTAGRHGLTLSTGNSSFTAKAINCSATSLNGNGFAVGQGGSAYRCVAKDCGEAGFFQSSSSPIYLDKCISYNNDVGLEMVSRLNSRITSMTIDDCTTYGIQLTSNSYGINIEDCNITNCGTGIIGTSGYETSNYADRIHFHGNGTDLTYMTDHGNNTSGDPEYGDAANGDLSTGSATITTRDFPYEESEDTYSKGAVEKAATGAEITYCVAT